MELKKLEGRADLKENGVWVVIKEGDDGEADFECKVAYMHRKAPRDYVAKEMARARRKMGNVNREVPFEISKRITTDTIFKFCLKDWRGLTRSREPIQYEEVFARGFFDANPEYLDTVVNKSGDVDNFGGKLSDEEREQGEAEGGAKAATKSEPALDS